VTAPGEARRRRPWTTHAGIVLTHLVLISGCVVLMVPFFWMVSTSLKHEWEAYRIPPQWIPTELVWSNYYDAVFKYFNFVRYGLNTLTITVGVLVGRLLSASLVAFGFARVRFFGRDALFILVLSTLMVPHQVTLIPLYVLFNSIGWLNTYLPLIVPAWFGGGAFFIFLLRQFMMGISPELDDAARIDGCGWLGIYGRILLPLIKPALAAVAIFSFLGTWNDFFGPMIILRDTSLFTLAIGLQVYSSAGLAGTGSMPVIAVVMAGATIIMLPPLLLFFFSQKYFIQGVVFTGLKG
jgi:ABC-type glycerol-3-phosphate transport system permease component